MDPGALGPEPFAFGPEGPGAAYGDFRSGAAFVAIWSGLEGYFKLLASVPHAKGMTGIRLPMPMGLVSDKVDLYSFLKSNTQTEK